MTPTNRARLLVLLSFPVVIGIAGAIRHLPQADEKLAWVISAETVLLIGVAVNARRQEHHLTWREFYPRVVAGSVALAVLFGCVMIVGGVIDEIRTNLQAAGGPVLVVVGVVVAVLGVVLLFLYLAVRVVRAAWKGQ
jgi:uncharacterized membrane protein HdeD (DUF308 family)